MCIRDRHDHGIPDDGSDGCVYVVYRWYTDFSVYHRYGLSLIHILSEALPDATVICGDGSDQELLKEERIQDVDSFVACTDMDEENIIPVSYTHLDVYKRQVIGVRHLDNIVRCRLLHFIFKLFDFRIRNSRHFFTGFRSGQTGFCLLYTSFTQNGWNLSMRIAAPEHQSGHFESSLRTQSTASQVFP